MTRKQKRMTSIAGILAVIGTAVGLTVFALSDSLAFFASPSDIVARAPVPNQRIRLGGVVEGGSLKRDAGESVRFRVTDSLASVPVLYVGLLPDLFREGQGVVAEGALGPDGVFVADTVLAKHDETYMPREVVDDLKARGLWKENTPLAASNRPAMAGAGM